MGNKENMSFGVFLALLGIFGISHGGDVTCTKDNYIMTGLEFSDCQKNALKSFKGCRIFLPRTISFENFHFFNIFCKYVTFN